MSMREIEAAIDKEVQRRMATAEHKSKEKFKDMQRDIDDARAISADRKEELSTRGATIETQKKRIKGLEEKNLKLHHQIKKYEAEREAAKA